MGALSKVRVNHVVHSSQNPPKNPFKILTEFPSLCYVLFGRIFKEFPQTNSICATVAAAAGALQAAGLGTADRGLPPRQRRSHKLKIF